MIVEALKPLILKFPGGERRPLQPGQPMELPDHLGHKLLAKAPGKVRALSPAVTVGQMVMWNSPLFGVLQAVALAVADKSVTVFHPLTEQEATIPLAWIRENR